MSSENKKGNVFIISGPSGCGKSTVLSRVMEQGNYYFSISATTREPRPGEKDGVNYHFLKREEFLDLLEKNEFLEHAEYVGNFYGTPITPVLEHTAAGEDVLLDIEVQGAVQVMSRLPEAISIFIAPPSAEELERRLRGRSTDADDKIKRRLTRASEELKYISAYDYIVVNDELEETVRKVTEIINKAKTKGTM